MFRQRKTAFINHKNWHLKARGGEFEIDEFDRDDTVYFCSLRPDGALSGSIRFLNTTTEHVAAAAFRNVFSALTVSSPTIWESTWFALPEDEPLQPNGVPRATCEIIFGIWLFGFEHGLTQMTAIYDATLARIFKKCGLTHFLLTRHRSEEHGLLHYGLLDISYDLGASIREATQIVPRLIEADIDL